MSIRGSRRVAVLLGASTLWACAKGTEKADSAALADSAARAAAAATPTPPPAPPPLSDANIVALVDEANVGDSTLAAIAAKMATAAAVKTFARDMMRDHHQLRVLGLDLAKKQQITPVPPQNDTLPSAVQRAATQLEGSPKGAAWDKAYIDGEVAIHQAVLVMLQNAQGATADTALKALIIKATPTIEGHLKRAQDIQSKLGSGATDTGKKGDTTKKP